MNKAVRFSQHGSELEMSPEPGWAHRPVYVPKARGLRTYYFVSPVVTSRYGRVYACAIPERDSWSPECPNRASMALMPGPGTGKAGAEGHSGFPQPVLRTVIKKGKLYRQLSWPSAG